MFCVPRTVTLEETARHIVKHKLPCVLVFDEDSSAVGLLVSAARPGMAIFGVSAPMPLTSTPPPPPHPHPVFPAHLGCRGSGMVGILSG